MAKDSNKWRVLERRKQEFDHALQQGAAAAIVARRAEKVRTAIIAVIKKLRGPFAHVRGAPGNKEWIELTERWERFTTDEIIDLAKNFHARPNDQDIRRATSAPRS